MTQTCCVIAFPYNHITLSTFDHHESTFITQACNIRPYAVSSKKNWDDKFLSCPSLLIHHFKKYYKDYSRKLKKRYGNLIKWSDIIDGAKYSSPSELYNSENVYLNISKTITQNNNAEYLNGIIKAFYFNNLDMIIKMDNYQNTLKKYKDVEKLALRIISDQIIVENNIAFFDQSNYGFPFQRYLAYYLYPDIKYRIAIYKKNEKYVVSVNYNFWKKEKNNINLGNMCYAFGGGGHNDVGAVMRIKHGDALKIARIIISRLENLMTEQLLFSDFKQI